MRPTQLALDTAVDAAQAAAEAGDFQTAAAAFQAAITLDQSDAALHEQLAQCLLELGQHDDAAKAAAEATTLRPAWPEAWLTLARSLLNAGELQGAHQACSQCLALDPSNTEAQDDMDTISGLLQQHISKAVGLPGMLVVAAPGGQTGPSCVIWEAGMELAKLFVELAALQQKGGLVQPCDRVAASTASGRATAEAGAAAGCSQCNVAAGTGAGISAAAPLLERVQLSELPLLQGAKVLELGSGTGIAGIAAAACGAHVTLTDLPAAQPLLCTNITRNEQLIQSAGGSATGAVLDWSSTQLALLHSSPCTEQQVLCGGCGFSQVHVQQCTEAEWLHAGECISLPHAAARWEWGCAADLVFNAGQVVAVVQAIASFLQPSADDPSVATTNVPRRTFLLAHKQRHEHVDQQLLQSFAQAGLGVSQLVWDSACCSQVCIWVIK